MIVTQAERDAVRPMGRTPREMLVSSDPAERKRAGQTLYQRVASGWDRERALDTVIGNKPGPLPGHRQTEHAQTREALRGVSLSPLTPYADDLEAQQLVAQHPDGMTLEEVGAIFGVTRERVRQIEATALRNLRIRCALVGIEPDDVAAMLATRPERGTPGAVTTGRPGGRPSDADRARAEVLPVAAWSEHGQRVEAALRELEDVSERLRRRCA